MSIIPQTQPLNRLCQDGFLPEYLNYTKHSESPEDFHFWMGISLIASVLGRRVWKDHGYQKIYPNLYIVLVAGSAMLRKSTAIRIAGGLLRESLKEELNFFSQKITTEALIQKLAELNTKIKRSEAVIESDEFATFLGKSHLDPSLLQILTDYYDCPDFREYTTRSHGTEKMTDVCINMRAGTTPEWLHSSMPEEAVGGGFWSRIIPIHRKEGARRIATPEDYYNDPIVAEAKKRCVNDLRRIYELTGECKWTAEGKSAFTDWYMSEDFNNPLKYPGPLQGYYGRKGTTIIKLAIVLSVSRSDSLYITQEDIMQAVAALGDNEVFIKEVTDGLFKTQEGKKLDRILELVKRYYPQGVPHSFALNQSGMNAQEFKLALDTLEASQEVYVELRHTAKKTARVYFYIPLDQRTDTTGVMRLKAQELKKA